MELLIKSFLLDWPVLTPILICSFLVIAVAIEKIRYYSKNKRDIGQFIQNLQLALAKNNIGQARQLSSNLGGIISEMTEEGLRIYTEQRAGFSRARHGCQNFIHLSGFGNKRKSIRRSCNRYSVSPCCNGVRSRRCDCCGYFI